MKLIWEEIKVMLVKSCINKVTAIWEKARVNILKKTEIALLKS